MSSMIQRMGRFLAAVSAKAVHKFALYSTTQTDRRLGCPEQLDFRVLLEDTLTGIQEEAGLELPTLPLLGDPI